MEGYKGSCWECDWRMGTDECLANKAVWERVFVIKVGENGGERVNKKIINKGLEWLAVEYANNTDLIIG